MIGRHTCQNPLPSLTSDLRRLAPDPTALRRPLTSDLRPPTSGFTLIELLVVIAIIVLVTAFILPAFTSIKGGGDVTSTAYTIKGVLDQARTYAMANDTYTAVGFAGSIGNTPASVTGQVYVATLASTDGTANGFA